MNVFPERFGNGVLRFFLIVPIVMMLAAAAEGWGMWSQAAIVLVVTRITVARLIDVLDFGVNKGSGLGYAPPCPPWSLVQ